MLPQGAFGAGAGRGRGHLAPPVLLAPPSPCSLARSSSPSDPPALLALSGPGRFSLVALLPLLGGVLVLGLRPIVSFAPLAAGSAHSFCPPGSKFGSCMTSCLAPHPACVCPVLSLGSVCPSLTAAAWASPQAPCTCSCTKFKLLEIGRSLPFTSEKSIAWRADGQCFRLCVKGLSLILAELPSA